jgi:serine/threonine protein kinase
MGRRRDWAWTPEPLPFFEDRNFYYLISPSTLPLIDSTSTTADATLPLPAKDLFEFVEQHPLGLPAHLVRSHPGQIADALVVLRMHGNVHCDIRDEDVVLSANDRRCWLIDFGSPEITQRNR